MRPWFKLVAASNTWHPDSTWDNSRSTPIPRGPAEEGLCCPRHVPGKLWGSLFLLAYSPLGEESKPETDPGGDTRRGRCSLLRTRKQPDGDRRGWPERPCKLTLLKAAATSVKWGTPKVLRLSRDGRMKCWAGCLEEAAPRTGLIQPRQILGFPTTQGPVILRNHVVFCFSAQGMAT